MPKTPYRAKAATRTTVIAGSAARVAVCDHWTRPFRSGCAELTGAITFRSTITGDERELCARIACLRYAFDRLIDGVRCYRSPWRRLSERRSTPSFGSGGKATAADPSSDGGAGARGAGRPEPSARESGP